MSKKNRPMTVAQAGRLGGRIGGKSTSKAKAAASRANGKLRGRLYPPCPYGRVHLWDKNGGRCTSCDYKRFSSIKFVKQVKQENA